MMIKGTNSYHSCRCGLCLFTGHFTIARSSMPSRACNITKQKTQ